MTSEEALEKILKTPEAERNETQIRTTLFLGTIKMNPVAWEKVRLLPIPPDVEQKLFGDPPPKEAT